MAKNGAARARAAMNSLLIRAQSFLVMRFVLILLRFVRSIATVVKVAKRPNFVERLRWKSYAHILCPFDSQSQSLSADNFTTALLMINYLER